MSSIDIINSKPFLEYISKAIEAECLGYIHQPQESFGRENENYFLGVKTGDKVVELVLRCKPNSVRPSREGYDEDYIRKEFYLLKELERLDLGYKTPKVWGLAHGGLL